MRRTKIVCTIGPATDTEEMIRQLMENGMNVARFNFSHGTHEDHARHFEILKKLSQSLHMPVAALLDTKGPEIRLGLIPNGPVVLERGQDFTLTIKDVEGDSRHASVSYKDLVKDVGPGSRILIDDGNIELECKDVDGDEIHCRVVVGGPISSRKGVNIPGTVLSMPFISTRDRSDLEFGAKMGFDFVAASFVRTAEDIHELRALLQSLGSSAKIISKIESAQAIENIDAIIEASDGIMIARGDLGVEVPMEEVPVLQKEIIKKAIPRGKYVITATQMLDSMIHNPRPTRAEAADVANAVYDGTSAVMLSGETAAGEWPAEAVHTMATICERTERDIDYVERLRKVEDMKGESVTTAISHATAGIAAQLNADAIITVTTSGYTATMVSRFKPASPIIGCSSNPQVCRQLNLMWGITPLLVEEADNAEELFAHAVARAKEEGLVKVGDLVVLTAGVPVGVKGTTNLIHVVRVQE